MYNVNVGSKGDHMDINKLTIGEAREIAALFGSIGHEPIELKAYTPTVNPMVGKHCVVRTYSAGVHIGTVEAVNGTEVLLSNSRRLWNWTTASKALSLNEVATNGIAKDSKLAVSVETIYLTEAIELIPTTMKARETYETIKD